MDEGVNTIDRGGNLLELRSQHTGRDKQAGYEMAREERTQVTSKDTKKSNATFVYPQAAVFASIAALLFFGTPLVGVGGTSNRGLRGALWISTVYWS